MNLDEFEYMVTNAQVTVGKTICFYTPQGSQIVGTISKLARFGQRVIGVELAAQVPAAGEITETSMSGETVAIPAIGEPPEYEPMTVMTTIYVPASSVIAAEWASE